MLDADIVDKCDTIHGEDANERCHKRPTCMTLVARNEEL